MKKKRYLKKIPKLLRILLSAATLFLAVQSFALFWFKFPFWRSTQLGPALLRCVSAFTLSALLLIAVQFLLAFLFGRFYCAFFCPLGVLQDLIGFFSFRRARIRNNHRLLRYTILGLALGGLFFSWTFLWLLLEPFSVFGRMTTETLNPLYHSLLLRFSETATASYFFPTPVMIVFGGVIPFLFLLLLCLWEKRIYCTALCPVGTLLGLCAAHGVFRLTLKENCIRCGRCVTACPAGCIDPQKGRLDNERCLRCMNCVALCPVSALRYGPGAAAVGGRDGTGTGFAETKAEMPSAPLRPANAETKTNGAVEANGKSDANRDVENSSRRDFLLGGTVFAAAFLLGGASSNLAKKTILAGGKNGNLGVYPPGAGSAARFTSLCTNCQLCVANCKGKVLVPPDGKVHAVHLDYTRGMCEFNCRRCSKICPTGAIRPFRTQKEKQLCRIGLARFDAALCVAVQDGTSCGACAEHCPTGALRMLQGPDDPCPRPVLTEELCIGCGNCEYPCPVRPLRAIRVQGIPLQLEATDPDHYFKPVEHPSGEDLSGGDWLI